MSCLFHRTCLVSASILVWILSFCISSPCAFAAEVQFLTLEQAISIAMEKNRDIEKAREYGRYVQGKYVEERSAALPQFGITGAAYLAKDESQKATSGSAPRQSVTTLDLTLSQTLYTWGKVNAAIRAAEVGLKTADQQLRLYRQAALREVSTAYYDILLAKELHRLAQDNLAQKKRHLDEAQRRFAAGVATDYDMLAAEVAVENARPDVIRTENTIRTVRERLRFLLALDGQEVDAAGVLETPLTPPLVYDDALTLALSKRPELLDMKLRIGIYGELVTIAAADNKPRLDLKGGVGWHWLGLNDPGPASDANGAAWNIGVYLSFPFFDGMKTSGRVTQAQSDLRTKQIEEAKLKDAIALEVRDTGNSVREAIQIVQALSGTVKQAERLLGMAEKGFEFGVKIRLEVDDAQLNLTQARGNLARAHRDYRVAWTYHEWAMGVAGEERAKTP